MQLKPELAATLTALGLSDQEQAGLLAQLENEVQSLHARADGLRLNAATLVSQAAEVETMAAAYESVMNKIAV